MTKGTWLGISVPEHVRVTIIPVYTICQYSQKTLGREKKVVCVCADCYSTSILLLHVYEVILQR